MRQLGERRRDKPSLVGCTVDQTSVTSTCCPVSNPWLVTITWFSSNFAALERSSRNLAADALQPEYVIGDAHRLIEKLELGQVDLPGSLDRRARRRTVCRQVSDQVDRYVAGFGV